MAEKGVRDWRQMWSQVAELLHRRTGKDFPEWNRRVRARRFTEESELRRWLSTEGVTGYPQTLLVMERFGYPEFLTASADVLVGVQYQDRQALRPIYEAILAEARTFGDLTVQLRKGYVALVGPKRTFARIRATTRTRVDLGLRLAGLRPSGRWHAARIHDSLTAEIGLTELPQFDAEVRSWLRRAYEESR